MLFKKFPDYYSDDKKIYWDTRQLNADTDYNSAAIFYNRLDGSLETLNAFQAKFKNLEVVDEKNTGEFGIYLHDLKNNPSRELNVVGVTGTNGKTTTATIFSYMSQQLGYKVLEIGSLGLRVYKANETSISQTIESGYTTPDSSQMPDLFSQAIEQGFDVVVMELSSHASSLGRISGIDLDCVLMNSFGQDHLDFHKTLESYKNAKIEIFSKYLPFSTSSKKKLAIVDAEISFAEIIKNEVDGLGDIAFTSYKSGVDFKVSDVSVDGFKIQFNGKSFAVPLIGAYNAKNIYSCFMAIDFLFSKKISKDVLKDFSGVPGRMQKVPSSKKDIFIDSAHTPDSITAACSELSLLKKNKNSKLWIVFGSGGDRDVLKRPLMLEAALKDSDCVVVTSDNPRTEDPAKIIYDILANTSAATLAAKKDMNHVVSICDRKKAIKHAVINMDFDDLLLIAGKGHERYQICGSQKLEFNEEKICLDFLNSL